MSEEPSQDISPAMFDGPDSYDYQPKQIHTVAPRVYSNGGGVQWTFKCEHEVKSLYGIRKRCDADVLRVEGDYWLEWWAGTDGEFIDVPGPFKIESWWDNDEEIYWKPVDVEVKTEPIT